MCHSSSHIISQIPWYTKTWALCKLKLYELVTIFCFNHLISPVWSPLSLSLSSINCHLFLSFFPFWVQVLPSLREKHDEFMLRELVKRWANHKIMVRWLSRFFHYLDRYFIARRSLPPLNEVGLTCFRDLVMLQWNLHDAMLMLFINYFVHDINKHKLCNVTANWVAFLLLSLQLMLLHYKKHLRVLLFAGLQGTKWESERCSYFACMFFFLNMLGFLCFCFSI